ncbi:hypothetical protein V8D89_010543 [Ganoderma adspersum]
MKFIFDAVALLSGRTNSIAYVAFFRDVEHEVAPVVSGHRVTLTYNLYYGARRNTTSPDDLEVLQPPHARVSESAVKDSLASLLDDPIFMPRGGTLGFGLRHHYPFPLQTGQIACTDPGMSSDLRFVKDAESKLLQHDLLAERELSLHREFRGEKKQTMYWLYWFMRRGSGPAYWNNAVVEWSYMRVGLLVSVGPHERRTEEPEIKEDAGERAPPGGNSRCDGWQVLASGGVIRTKKPATENPHVKFARPV